VDIVIIGGPHSGVGKTLACERALHALSGRRFGAIKLTVADGEFDAGHDHGRSALAVADAAGICGRGASCGVCETVSSRVPSRTVVSERAILKRGTDTWRLSQAGAIAVAWIITLRSAAPEAIDKSIVDLRSRGAEGILIEGTTALDWLDPTASAMIATDPGRGWKRLAEAVIGRCDVVVRNRLPVACGSVPAPAVLSASDPLDCDLGRADDAGTMEFQRRIAELCVGAEPKRTSA
jgi:molybdopterin-guanine dinucleotide biosynthesis protein